MNNCQASPRRWGTKNDIVVGDTDGTMGDAGVAVGIHVGFAQKCKPLGMDSIRSYSCNLLGGYKVRGVVERTSVED